MKIDWNETSTRRGTVRIVTFGCGLVMLFTNTGSIEQLLLLAAGVNGMIGMAMPDKSDH